jgi:hypothetical protein
LRTEAGSRSLNYAAKLSAFILAFGLPICGEMRVAIKEILT